MMQQWWWVQRERNEQHNSVIPYKYGVQEVKNFFHTCNPDMLSGQVAQSVLLWISTLLGMSGIDCLYKFTHYYC